MQPRRPEDDQTAIFGKLFHFLKPVEESQESEASESGRQAGLSSLLPPPPQELDVTRIRVGLDNLTRASESWGKVLHVSQEEAKQSKEDVRKSLIAFERIVEKFGEDLESIQSQIKTKDLPQYKSYLERHLLDVRETFRETTSQLQTATTKVGDSTLAGALRLTEAAVTLEKAVEQYTVRWKADLATQVETLISRAGAQSREEAKELGAEVGKLVNDSTVALIGKLEEVLGRQRASEQPLFATLGRLEKSSSKTQSELADQHKILHEMATQLQAEARAEWEAARSEREAARRERESAAAEREKAEAERQRGREEMQLLREEIQRGREADKTEREEMLGLLLQEIKAVGTSRPAEAAPSTRNSSTSTGAGENDQHGRVEPAAAGEKTPRQLQIIPSQDFTPESPANLPVPSIRQPRSPPRIIAPTFAPSHLASSGRPTFPSPLRPALTANPRPRDMSRLHTARPLPAHPSPSASIDHQSTKRRKISQEDDDDAMNGAGSNSE